MDAPNPSAIPTFASRTPLHIGAIGLKVRDLDRFTNFYRDVLGLAVIDRANDSTALGAGGVPLTGASDHAVSEAFYLDDPEGNGVEVYCDRPAETWEWTGTDLKITTDPLDVESILREVPPTATYPGAPDGLRIGHVHLRVGDVARAEAFYRDALGLDVTRRRQGATFLSSGRYHHHIAGNVWHSAGAGRRQEGRAGLSWLSLE